jgi:uncharacterized protein
MSQSSREFQVFVKPAGPACNLNCLYCYYLKKDKLFPPGKSFRMPDDILESYIIQHIDAASDPVITFSWHGGEPTILGLDYFRGIVDLQKKHLPHNRKIINGIQTNGTLLNEEWCRFFKGENFIVGISLDGPEEMHDRYRFTRDKKSTFDRTLNGYKLLQRFDVLCEILCAVNADNVKRPLEIYRFFRQLDAKYITFLPVVEKDPAEAQGIAPYSVPPEAFGSFLCDIFDEWIASDIGRIKIQIFEEATRTAFGQDHTLCIFKKTCGGVPVVEHNGDFYSCDHFVDHEHHLGNIREKSLAELLDDPAQIAFGQAKLDTLPRYCQMCEVRDMCNGECPKNRFLFTPDGEPGLNWLCAGYKKFFNHCIPFVLQVAELWKQQKH